MLSIDGEEKSSHLPLMFNNKPLLRGVIGLMIATVSPLFSRTFTSTDGQKIEGDMIQVTDGNATIKLTKNGREYAVPLTKFSEADRKFIKQWTKEQAAESTSDNTAKPAKKKKKARGVSDRPMWQWRAAQLKEKFNIEDNFDNEWPTLVSYSNSPEIATVEEDEENSRYVYHSPNYEFISDVRLSKNVVKKFATLFEATREFCKVIPISSIKARLPDSSIRYKILLFEKKETYFKNGGPPGSGGVFMSGKQIIMVPLTSLGVKKVGSGYSYDYKGQNKTLPHEIAHQLTDNEYYSPGARGWFTEGMAEYIAVTSYRSGKFMVRNNLKEIKEYATAYGEKGKGGRNLGEEFRAPNLKDYMLQPYSSFTSKANFNYGFGLLITYYYFHMDKDGDRTSINAFLKSLKNGKRGEEALEVLRAGRTWDEMEEAITKAWRSRGVKISFS